MDDMTRQQELDFLYYVLIPSFGVRPPHIDDEARENWIIELVNQEYRDSFGPNLVKLMRTFNTITTLTEAKQKYRELDQQQKTLEERKFILLQQENEMKIQQLKQGVVMSSPRLGNCVGVLLYEGEPAGTTFYVGNNKFLTVAHNVLEADYSVAVGRFSVTMEVVWLNNKMEFQNEIEVTVFNHNQADDWAVLLCQAPVVGIAPIEICTEASIPPMREEPEYKLYHCPAEEFNKELIEVLEATTLGWFKPRSINKRTGHIWFPYGASKGSSGGVIVNRSGQAVAMHLDSRNSALTVDDAKADPSCVDDDDAFTLSIDSGANTHCSIAKCLILSHFDDLMAAIS